MERKIIAIHFTLLFSLIFLSCKKESAQVPEKEIKSLNSYATEINDAQTKFAILLAKALKSDPALRGFIKEESLKQFDNDYDILYQMVKDKKINGQESLHEKLVKVATSEDEIDSIENKLPLLTIFVPEVPNFSAEKWNPTTQIPVVAAANTGEGTIKLYDGLGKELLLKPLEIPGFPVLVIKQNERIITRNSSDASSARASADNSLIAYQNANSTFSFADEAFNGMVSKTAKSSTGRVVSPGNIDPVNVAAYNSGNEWHRDYVYYGITAAAPNGTFRNNYSEFITSFKFLTPNALGIISDQDEDPKASNLYSVFDWNPPIPKWPWSEGNFEFSITILINAKNGIGNEITKLISVSPYDLFDLYYEPVGNTSVLKYTYKLKSITPKEFHPNVELIPWDLQNYGTAWKFIIYEKDNAQEVINTFENSSTFAANFGLDLKIGLKFGASLTTTSKNSFSVKTTLTSDFLGEATLSFDQPIIIGQSNGNYITREITTGNLLSLSVEPRKVF